jgi:two-component system KDP operon response regulator KdpE
MAAARRVLILTSLPERRRPLADYLSDLGYRIDVTSKADPEAETDLAIIDVVDDKMWSAAEQMAEGRFILIVHGPESLARAFELGADDCVLDQARVEEIAARCEAVMRRTGIRTGVAADVPAVYADRRLWINFDSRQVWVGGRQAQLTPREFRLLKELVQHRDKTLTHEELLELVWGREPAKGRTPEVLKQYVWRLRQKIEPDPNEPMVILTDPGEGYRFQSRSD